MNRALIWFRRDLRLSDHAPLMAAQKAGLAPIPVYIHSPTEEAPHEPGAASNWWLHGALAELDRALRERGSRLLIRCGPTLEALAALIAETGASAVYWTRLYDPALVSRDTLIKQALKSRGLDAQSHAGDVLIEPQAIETKTGTPYRVFSPYWRNARAALSRLPPAPAPSLLPAVDESLASISLADLRLRPTIPWDREFHALHEPGEAGALALVESLIDAVLPGYSRGRERPDQPGTSRLSPHLHFGAVHPRRLAFAVLDAAEASGEAGLVGDAEHFVRELGWRDFNHHLLFHFPASATANLNRDFDAFPWTEDGGDSVRRWQQGQTGIPIVDAGMRELWRSGWMHNRVRMIVASFLTKNLLTHWRVGAAWFWDTLLDADLANNTAGWQWAAGSGADAAPYFRIFNPVSQGQKFDPNGDYVRRYVPELAGLSAPAIHEPWAVPAALRSRLDYPAPVVDLKTSREVALDAYRRMQGARRG